MTDRAPALPDTAYYDRVRRWSATLRYARELCAVAAALDLDAPGRLLDVGCGTGTALRLFAARGNRAVGIDLPASWPAACEVRPVARADAAALPFLDASFDTVVIIHAFAHLPSPATALAEIHRVLVPGGRLGIVTPNRRYLQTMAAVGWLTRYRPDPTVVRQQSVASISELLAAAGFDVTRARPWGKLPWLAPFGPLRERIVVVAERSRNRKPLP